MTKAKTSSLIRFYCDREGKFCTFSARNHLGQGFTLTMRVAPMSSLCASLSHLEKADEGSVELDMHLEGDLTLTLPKDQKKETIPHE